MIRWCSFGRAIPVNRTKTILKWCTFLVDSRHVAMQPIRLQKRLVPTFKAMVVTGVNMVQNSVKNKAEFSGILSKTWYHVCVSARAGKSPQENVQSVDGIANRPLLTRNLVRDLRGVQQSIQIIFCKPQLCSAFSVIPVVEVKFIVLPVRKTLLRVVGVI